MKHVVRTAALATVLLLAVTPQAAAGGTSPDQVPVAGTVAWQEGQSSTLAPVRGAVHAVRRVEGGTAVYYSLGVPAGETAPAVYNGVFPSPGLYDPYSVWDFWRVYAVDAENLMAYRPMIGAQGCLCPRVDDFTGKAGELNVGWAILPELPAGVDTVDVVLGYGATVSGVPVGEGPLEPVAEGASVPLLGQGWPELPDVAAAGIDDTADFVLPLERRSGDLEQTVRTSEQPEQVEVALAADVLFAVDSAELSAGAQDLVDDVAAQVVERGSGPVTVVGHTDDTGDDTYNTQLSLRRAQAVVAALQEGPAAGVSFTTEGRGESEPAASNDTDSGRQLNRRVTITFAVEEKP